MNPLLRTLEDWTTYQDYLWFLAVLAWGAVLWAEFRQREHAGGADAPGGWMRVLAASQIGGALLELVLLAQDIRIPYTRLDAAMGAAQAAGAAALAWGATRDWRWRGAWRAVAVGGLAGLAVARVWWPVEGGFALTLGQTLAVLGLLRQTPIPLPAVAGGLLAVLPVIATHGPWAYAINQGRKTTDFSHFALFAAGASLAAGATTAMAIWRARLEQAGTGEGLRRDLRRAVFALVAWLGCGVLLAVWYGRQARRAFEENLLRRVETTVLAIDPHDLVEALSPALRIESVTHKHTARGLPVDVALVPVTSQPVYARLRAATGRLRELNPDIYSLYLATWRQGHLLELNSEPRTDAAITHVIHHDIRPEDLDRLAARRSFIEGPARTSWGALLMVRAPLFNPATGQLLGWLAADVEATRWAVTFTQARLQTMALVAVGVGLWVLAVAYRLRREARDAAEQRAATSAAADRMKSAFLAKVSHELRTPIQSVLGYGELLAGAPLAEPHRAWLAALRSHGGVMLRLVNDLIDLGALQSGAFRLEPAPVALPALVDECATALRPAAAAKGLEFRSEIAAGVPGWVLADGVRVRQVLLNLITNAIKFTPAGRVTLQVRRGEDGQVEFAVTDTGPGIPVALRARLFQPFARLDPAATEGSGLGLALVQGLCSVMGGDVQLLDTAEPGATFLARLPLPPCGPPAGEVAGKPNAGRDFAGLRVLVAEDNTLVRELLTAFLVENGAEVAVAVDGPTALKLACDRAPGVLLLDIALPGLDGIAVAEALRREGPRALRIIGLSAHASAADEKRARAAGMDVFLAKPVSLARLAQAIMDRSSAPGAAEEFAAKISDDRLRARLAEQFSCETPRVLAEMRAALAAGDWPRLRSRAHYMKNSADVLGATMLQNACQRLAALEDRPEPAAARHLLEAVEAAVPPMALPFATPGDPGRN